MGKQFIEITNYLNPPAQEAFRVLSTNLKLNVKHKNLKVISVVSFNSGEGKTSLAKNLAIASSKSGNRVLCVDADLRKPARLKPYEDDSIKGITDLCEELAIEDIICQTSIENLNYVTAGNKLVDPIEFLHSQIYEGFLESTSSQYDRVFIDSSPIGNYVDGAIIAKKSSGVLIVARAQKTQYKNIERIKWQLNNVGANIIGIVINQITRREYKSYSLLHNNYKYLAKNKGMEITF